MTKTGTPIPLFLSTCPDCLGNVRWINDRPEPHACLREQDDAIATPWRNK